MARTVLWHLEASHYSDKVRWALDHKRLPHARRAVIPGFQAPVAKLLSGQPRLPVLELAGRRISDSTRIIAALEEHVPQPPLYPADPALRERALALEDFFDEKVAKAVRGFLFEQAGRRPQDMLAALAPSATGVRRAFMLGVFTVLGPLARRYYRGTAEQVRAGMDRLEQELDGCDHLVGDRFTVADLTAAAVFTPLLAPPQRPHPPRSLPAEALALREELTARPGGRWVFETYARYR